MKKKLALTTLLILSAALLLFNALDLGFAFTPGRVFGLLLPLGFALAGIAIIWNAAWSGGRRPFRHSSYIVLGLGSLTVGLSFIVLRWTETPWMLLFGMILMATGALWSLIYLSKSSLA